MYSDAPLNYLQVFDSDILYASGLSNCSFSEIAASAASPGACQAITSDTQATQTELNLASQMLLNIAE
jgi:hypothetical protein